MPKLAPVPFSRGTKLSIDQLSANLVPDRDAIQTPSLDTDNLAHSSGRFDVAIPLPALHSPAFEDKLARIAVPFPMLPLQDEWNASLVAGPTTPRPRLRSISISINQRAEGYGIGDYWSTDEGKLTATDMTRYDTTFELVSKPLAMTQTGVDRYARHIRTVWSTTLPGADLLGLADATPVLFNNLNETMDPYAGHWLIITCPGLFTTNPAQTTCAIPSLLVVLTFDRVLTQRDTEVQNGPIDIAPSPTPLALTLPASNQAIAQVHTQGNLEVLDAPVARKLDAGWQPYGEIKPTEQLLSDSSYSVIGIPLWAGWESLRQQGINSRGLPYIAAPWKTPTGDRRLCVLPDGFVLHHCLLWRSQASYPAPVSQGYIGGPQLVVPADYRIKVGLGLVQGWDTEDTRYQQAAYLELTGISLTNNTVDTLGQLATFTAFFDGILHYVPLVYPNTDPSANGFYQTGKPIYIGRGNRKTKTRTGTAPAPNTGAVYITPVTDGQETHVEARMTMEDTVNGLDGGGPDTLILGYGGAILWLVGKMPLASQDRNGY